MSEPSYHPSSQGPMPTSTIAVHDVRTGPPHEGQLGEGVWLQTDRGTIHAIRHPSPEGRYGVIWVCGARGGFGGPGQGAYVRLAEALRQEGIVSLRLDYRYPDVLPECALDILAGVASLQQDRARPVVLVGHSFGGAVVIAAGAVNTHVAGVVALAPQTYGAPRGAVGAASTARGPWESRHTAAVHLRRADLRLGAGTETAGPVRGSRAPLRRMRRCPGPAAHAVDSHYPALCRVTVIL
jgi:pimeloyl-ACP methyl ester carboxylesterase